MIKCLDMLKRDPWGLKFMKVSKNIKGIKSKGLRRCLETLAAECDLREVCYQSKVQYKIKFMLR